MLFAQIYAPTVDVAPAPASQGRKGATPDADPAAAARKAAADVVAADAQIAQEQRDREAADARQRELDEKQDDAEEQVYEEERSNLISPSPGRGLGGLSAMGPANARMTSGLSGASAGALGATPTSANGEEEGSMLRAGIGYQYAGLASIVAGYDDNVVQALESPTSNVVRRYGSPFIGADVLGIFQSLGGRTEWDLRFQARGQHYIPTETIPNLSDDGTVNAAYSVRRVATGKLTLAATLSSTLSTLNSARQSDTTVLVIDPYSVQRTYTLSMGRASYDYEIANGWKWNQGVDATVSTVVHDSPITDENGNTISPRGLDYAQFGSDATLSHDFSMRNVGFMKLRYQYLYSRLFLNYLTSPPTLNGSYGSHLGTAELGWTHIFGNHFSAQTVAGAQVSNQLIGTEESGPIVSPLVMETLTYEKQSIYGSLSGGYSYGSVNPRLGLGTTASGALTFIVTPWLKGKLANLSIMTQGQVAHTTLADQTVDQTSGGNQIYNVYAASAELRYGMNRWLGLTAGYNFRYSAVEGSDAVPALWRNIYFVGLMGYWSSERVVPPLTTFSSPIQGG